MSYIQRDVDDRVLTISLKRESRMNALTHDMYVELTSIFEEADNDDDVRSVVVRGSSYIFSAGNDLEDFLIHPPRELDAPVWKFLQALSRFRKPVVAAVCGMAIGIGMSALLHMDIIICSNDAKFAMPFVSLGVCPEAGSSLLLPRLVGYQRACELLLLGGTIDASRAERFGIVNYVVPRDEVFALAEATARKLAALPAAALSATRALLRDSDHQRVDERMAVEAGMFGGLLINPDAEHAIKKFLRKKSEAS
ncbi:enoyl-CoA hydratase-related protein [Paraburkholderia xenovorans]|uniref:enoyl-CoA hydratase-related protein n=1 Tax=Paraburkholderia xenovorans TaxID=36873 RepID=UPI0038BAB4C5